MIKIYLLTILFLSETFAQNRPQVSALRASSPIKIDGELNEEIWTKIVPITEFTQRLPNDGSKPTENSEMKIAYDDNFLYFGFIFYDKEPEKIRANILDRGGRINRDDFIHLTLDTYLDRRNAYLFEMNPLGTQDDALITDETRPSLDEWAWDGVFYSEGRVSDIGWTLEAAIPWETLRFPNSKNLTMGIAIKRYINRKNESVIWPHIPLSYSSGVYQVSQFANLVGLKNVKRGKDIKIKPYTILGSQFQSNENSKLKESIKDNGIDIYYGLKSNLTLNLTYNTDFAQVESDNAQINLTRFNLFYPEKREFFLTRSKLFAFGNPRDTEIFFSRRIGLNQDVLGGARLFGQLGKTSIGALNIHTKNDNEYPASSYSVFRLRRNVKQRATIGAIFTDVSSSSNRNTALGLDGQARFWGSSSISGWYSEVDNNDVKSASSMMKINLKNDSYYLAASHNRVDKDFNPSLGFVARDNMIKNSLSYGYTPRVGSGEEFIRQWKFSSSIRDIKNINNKFETGMLSGKVEAVLESKDRIALELVRTEERLKDSFSLANGLQIISGNYRDNQITLSARTNDSRVMFGNIKLSSGDYFSGEKTSIRADLARRFSKHLTLGVLVNQNIINMPGQGEFDANMYAINAVMALNRNWFGKALIQYDNFSEELQLYCRINWIHKPGSDLFVVFNRRYDIGNDENKAIQSTQVVKLTYLFQI